MDWINLISTQRLGKKIKKDDAFARTEFERDWDRIIFSNAFRRLQNKTQVFPLPGRHLVHNRLTHSLEVASVGRSLGKIVGTKLENKYKETWKNNNIKASDVAQIIACACLAHDIGNPPFGHSGEDAISHFYNKMGEGLGGFKRSETDILIKQRWSDLDTFEGNANTFRVLVKTTPGLVEGGIQLTYSTLATIMKYPRNSLAKRRKSASEKKYGFFESEELQYEQIAQTLKIDKKDEGGYVRHPLTFLMEAADDICNYLLDIEDSCKLNIITEKEFTDLTEKLINEDFDKGYYVKADYTKIRSNDTNESLSYLRARAINTLIYKTSDLFLEKENDILSGKFNEPLIDNIATQYTDILSEIDKIKKEKIFVNRSVLEIEAAGFEVLGGLLDIFVNEFLYASPKNLKYSKKLKGLLPKQYFNEYDNDYIKLMKINDFVSGMTDIFAVDFYRNLKGISLPTNY